MTPPHIDDCGRVDNSILRFVAGVDTDPSSASPRAEIRGDAGGMHCAILEWAASQDDLALHVQAALVRLVRLMDSEGRIALPQAEIAAGIRLSERQTRTIIKDLVGAGALVRKRRGAIGKGRQSDLLCANLDRQHDNGNHTQLPHDNSDTADNVAPSPVSVDNAPALPVSPPLPLSAQNPPGASPAPSRVRDNLLKGSNRASSGTTEPFIDVVDDVAAREHPRPLAALVLRIAAEAASPYLSPAKSPGLHTTSARIQAWMDAGADLEADIIPTVRTVCGRLNGHGEQIETWKFFDKAIRKATAQRKSAEQPMELITASEAQNDRNGTYHARPGNSRSQMSPGTEYLMRQILGDQQAR